CIVFFFLNYTLFNIIIKKFDLPTPGRKGNYIEDEEDEENIEDNSPADKKNKVINKIITLLGGKDNISDVDACMTRLRVTVKDSSLVGELKNWKKTGAIGLIVKDTGVQAVYGPKADNIKNDILENLGR
ncbi:MAG: glucose PTS transporter subunit EIIB, partial [Fusobacteriaceae bacterium]